MNKGNAIQSLGRLEEAIAHIVQEWTPEGHFDEVVLVHRAVLVADAPAHELAERPLETAAQAPRDAARPANGSAPWSLDAVYALFVLLAVALSFSRRLTLEATILVILGSGEHHYEQFLHDLQQRFPGRVVFYSGYSEELAKLEAQRCIQCKDPKCVNACPVNIEILDKIFDQLDSDPTGTSFDPVR